MHFNLSWHKREIAEQWPKGSVVLCRRPHPKPYYHQHSYILSLHFMPDSMSFDTGYEYALIEEPKERK